MRQGYLAKITAGATEKQDAKGAKATNLAAEGEEKERRLSTSKCGQRCYASDSTRQTLRS